MKGLTGLIRNTATLKAVTNVLRSTVSSETPAIARGASSLGRATSESSMSMGTRSSSDSLLSLTRTPSREAIAAVKETGIIGTRTLSQIEGGMSTALSPIHAETSLIIAETVPVKATSKALGKLQKELADKLGHYKNLLDNKLSKPLELEQIFQAEEALPKVKKALEGVFQREILLEDVLLAKDAMPKVKEALKDRLPKEITLEEIIKAKEILPQVKAAFAKVAKGHEVSVADAVHMSIMKEAAAQTGVKKTWEKIAEEFYKEFMEAAQTQSSSQGSSLFQKIQGYKGVILAGVGIAEGTEIGSELKSAVQGLAKETVYASAVETYALIVKAMQNLGPAFCNMVADELTKLENGLPPENDSIMQATLEGQIQQAMLAKKGANLGITLTPDLLSEIDRVAEKIAIKVTAPEQAQQVLSVLETLANVVQPVYPQAIKEHKERHEKGESGGVLPTLDRSLRYLSEMLHVSMSVPAMFIGNASTIPEGHATLTHDMIQRVDSAIRSFNGVIQAAMDPKNAKRTMHNSFEQATQVIESLTTSLPKNHLAQQAAQVVASAMYAMGTGYEQRLGNDRVIEGTQKLGQLEKPPTPSAKPNDVTKGISV